MKDLTLRQQEIMGYIQLHLKQNGFWPSIREIQEHFNFASTNAVFGHLRALERKGYISRIPSQARTFRITHQLEEKPDESMNVIDLEVELMGQIARLQVDEQTPHSIRNRRSFALKVRGESMIDAGIFDGDIVVIEPRPARDGDVVAALIDGETTLKRFIQNSGSTPYLKAENPNYPELHPIGDLVIQGVAKAIVRNL